MSASVTVVGSYTYPNYDSLVTVNGYFVPGAVSALQSLLTTDSNNVVSVGASFQNIDVAGLSGSLTADSAAGSGIFELTNQTVSGASTAGSANVSVTVPIQYQTIIVQAPGTETVTGGGATGELAIFDQQSTVNFATGGGSGTVVAGGGGDFILASGTSYSVTGATIGNDTINSIANNSTITTYGQGNAVNNAIGADSTPSNVVGLAGTNATVISNGTNDLVETYSGSDIVSVNGSANVLINGGADTVYATASSTAVKAFFNLFGGTLDFINQSNTAATVSGAVPGASGGSTTAFGGAGGGIYIGGDAGNNSLVGGTGSVSLVGAGTNNFLSVQGSFGSYATENVLSAGAGGATMVAGSTTSYNEFVGGSGTDSIVSFGKGIQSYFVGSTGSEVITGSTATGAANNYYFDQDSSGNGADVITNFKAGRDSIFINANVTTSGVAIAGYESLGASNTIITLTDRTTITLYGVQASSLNASIVGGTSIT